MKELAEQRDTLQKTVQTTLQSILHSKLNDLVPELGKANDRLNELRVLQRKSKINTIVLDMKFVVEDRTFGVRIKCNGNYVQLLIRDSEHASVTGDNIRVYPEAYEIIDFYAHILSCNTLHDAVVESAETLVKNREKEVQEELEGEVNKYNEMLGKLKGPALECSVEE